MVSGMRIQIDWYECWCASNAPRKSLLMYYGKERYRILLATHIYPERCVPINRVDMLNSLVIFRAKILLRPRPPTCRLMTDRPIDHHKGVGD